MIFFIIVIIHFKALASSILEAFSEKSAAASLLLEVRFSLCSFPSIAGVEEPLDTFDKNHEMKGSHILTIFAIWAGLCLPGNIVTFYFLQKPVVTDLGENTTFNALETNESIFESMKDEPLEDHQDQEEIQSVFANLTNLQSKKQYTVDCIFNAHFLINTHSKIFCKN